MKINSLPLLVAATILLTNVAPAQNETEKPKGPERWESDMAKFEARDKATPPPEGAILFVGSSSIRMWDLKKSWPNLQTLNNGFGGSTLADSIFHFDRHIAPYKNPKAILIYAGDNDVAKGLDADGVLADFKTLRAKIKKAHPKTQVIFIAIKPSTKRWDMWPTMNDANQKIAELAKSDDLLQYADIATPTFGPDGGKPEDKWFKEDGLHLNEVGYAKWVEVMKPLLENAGAYKKD